MNISWDRTGGLLRGMGGMLQSTRDRLERQEETQRQVDFFEQQKGNLKNIKCESVQEIAEKLNMLHSYEDQIAAVKAAYNSEQMWHIMDESTERGEKIAEAAEKMEPKTPEERQEEMVEEALGIEDSGGMIEEIMDEVEELTEEVLENLPEEMTGEMPEAAGDLSAETAGEMAEEAVKDLPEELGKDLVEEVPENLSEEITADLAGQMPAETVKTQAEVLEMLKEGYVPFDVRL